MSSIVTCDKILQALNGGLATASQEQLDRLCELLPCAGDGSTTVSTADTQTVNLNGFGTSGSPLTAEVKISSNAGNQLVANAGGLFVPPSAGGFSA